MRTKRRTLRLAVLELSVLEYKGTEINEMVTEIFEINVWRCEKR